MNVGSLLAALGFAVVKAEAQRAARRLGRRVAVAALTGLLLATAVGFAIAAFSVWLAGEVGTIAALSIIAGGLVVLAGVVQGSPGLRRRDGQRHFRRLPRGLRDPTASRRRDRSSARWRLSHSSDSSLYGRSSAIEIGHTGKTSACVLAGDVAVERLAGRKLHAEEDLGTYPRRPLGVAS